MKKGIISFEEVLEILEDLQRNLLERISALQGELRKTKKEVDLIKKVARGQRLVAVLIEIESPDWETRKLLLFRGKAPEWLVKKTYWWYDDWDEVSSQLGEEGRDYYEFEL